MKLRGRRNSEQENHNIQVFARRVIDSPARFVFLLEFHGMPYAIQLMAGKASSDLRKAGFTDFFSEFDAIYLRTAYNYEKEKPGSVKLSEEGILEKEFLSNRQPTSLNYHMAGDNLTTFKEVRTAARKELKRDNLLVEKFMVKPIARMSKVLGVELFVFANLLERITFDGFWKQVKTIKQNVRKGIISAAVLHKEIRAAGGPEKFVDIMSEEMHVLQRLRNHYRKFGQCDTNSAKMILDAAEKQKGRGIINWGMAHGVIGDNPLSLPDQLVTQATARKFSTATIEIILMADSEYQHNIQQRLHEHQKLGHIIRDSVTVYDIEKRQEWPIRQWLEQAPAIYGRNSARPQTLDL